MILLKAETRKLCDVNLQPYQKKKVSHTHTLSHTHTCTRTHTRARTHTHAHIHDPVASPDLHVSVAAGSRLLHVVQGEAHVAVAVVQVGPEDTLLLVLQPHLPDQPCRLLGREPQGAGSRISETNEHDEVTVTVKPTCLTRSW